MAEASRKQTAQLRKRESLKPSANDGRPALHIIAYNHFDLIWRRPWDRPFTFKGDTYRSYAEIEDYIISDHLVLAQKDAGYRFSIEGAASARKFLERHPEELERLRTLAQQGRLGLPVVGENIIDANMVHGETLVRNFVLGLLWTRTTLGVVSSLGSRCDAFGNSAQLPQIFRGCGIAWVNGISYSPMQGDFWRGLDGSTVFVGRPPLPVVAESGGSGNCPVCRHCRGGGCRHCHGRGIDDYRCPVPKDPDDQLLRRAGAGRILMVTEEMLPCLDILDYARRLSRRYDVRFAIDDDFTPLVRNQIDLARTDRPPADRVHPDVEANPNNTGCYATRIRVKQRVRRQEHALLTLETLHALGGASPAARKAVRDAWRDVMLSCFHDAITGTHTDPAYAELIALADVTDRRLEKNTRAALAANVKAAPNTVSVFNPTGGAANGLATVEVPLHGDGAILTDTRGRRLPVVACRRTTPERACIDFVTPRLPPHEAAVLRVEPGPPLTKRVLRQKRIANAHFVVEADDHGLTRILDRKRGRTVAAATALRPNEMILERDEGSPWATLSPERTRHPLASYTALTAVESEGAAQRMIFTCTPPSEINCWGTRIVSTVELVEGLAQVRIRTTVRWCAFNQRLRVAMPVPLRGDFVYGIPHGQITRPPYPATLTWAGACGDWPAVGWAGVQDANGAVALLDKGLPSRLAETAGDGSVLFLTLLRSPTLPTYIHQPWHVIMTDWDGMRDEGVHEFEYALTAYDTPFAGSAIVADAESFNAGFPTVAGRWRGEPPLAVREGPVRIAALKPAEQGGDLVARLVEFRGKGGPVRLRLRADIRAIEQTNLLEEEAAPLPIADGHVTLTVRPWQLVTLRLQRPPRKTAVQVCMSLAARQTEEREIAPLANTCQYFGIKKAQIVTLNEQRLVKHNGIDIEVVPAWKWLLEGKG